jgi:hypothetical protein
MKINKLQRNSSELEAIIRNNTKWNKGTSIYNYCSYSGTDKATTNQSQKNLPK